MRGSGFEPQSEPKKRNQKKKPYLTKEKQSCVISFQELQNPVLSEEKWFCVFGRIRIGSQTGGIPLDWMLGAFILQTTMLESLEQKTDSLVQIVGNESVTYFSLFAVLLIAVLAAFFVLKWRKPQLKTIYDLEKGRYIVTRVPR